MSDLNNITNNENGVETSTQKKESLFNKFIIDFSASYFFGESKNSRLDSIFKSETLSPDIKRHLELFLATKREEFSSGVSSIDLNKINVFDFRQKLLSKYLELENKRQLLKDIVLDDYLLTTEEVNTLDKKISSLSDDEINKYINKGETRKKFLKTMFSSLVDKQSAVKDFFLKYNLLDGYTDLSDVKKVAIMGLFNNDGTLRKIDTTIFEDLFSVGVFSLVQKKEIVSYFMPSISLTDIKSLKLFGDSTSEKVMEIKKSIVDSFLKENKLKSKNGIIKKGFDVNDLLLSLVDDSFRLSTSTLFNTSGFDFEKLNSLVENTDFSYFVESYNNLLNQVGEHESKSEFQDGLDSFKSQLGDLSNVNGIENFKEGNYIVLDLYLEADEKADKDITKQFFKIKKLDNGEYGLSLIDSGFGSLDLLSTDSKDVSYKNFLTLLKKGLKINSEKFLVSKCNFSTKNSLDENVKKGLVDLLIQDDKTKSEIEEELKLSQLKEKENALINLLNTEISNLDVIKEIDKEISDINLELLNSSITEERKTELILKLDSTLERKRTKISELLSSEDNNLPENILNLKNDLGEVVGELSSLENIYTFDKLLKNVDEYDDAGKKYGLEEGVSFTSSKGIFTITKIDNINGTLDINGLGGLSKDITFKDFFQEFKKIKSKRLSLILDFSNLITSLNTDTSLDTELVNIWSEYEIKNNGIHKKGSTKDIEYDYLKAKESNDLINIENISGNIATVSFGEYDEFERDENGNIKKDEEGNKIKKSSITMYTGSTMQVSISWLEAWIKKNEARPSSIDENKDTEKTNIKGEKIKGSFWSRQFNRLSVIDILSGFKIGLDSIESYLKEGTDEKSARAAQGLFGKFLPEALKDDLMSRVEESQKKRSDDYISKLSNVDSWKATRMIIDWLKNKNAPQYLKEAGALFMLQKYGVLYAKDLHQYKGKFLFYESFGGKIGDELFEQVKAEAKATNQNFTEEQLLFILVKKQCGEKGYKQIRRRSRYHKEFKKHRNVGKQDEYETGKGDAKDERTVGARIGGGMGELYGGTYANARGWLEEAVNKGGSMEEMNKIPFVMAFSGISYNFEQNELDQLKNFPASSRMLPVLRFLSLNKDIDLMNETILEVAKRYSEIKGESDVYNDALKIFSKQKSNYISEAKKIEETEKFYKKYGNVMTDILYMLNTGKSGDKNKDSYLSKMILIEKDDRVDDNGNIISGNTTFKRYFNLLHAYAGEFNFGNDDLYGDAFSGKGTSGINVHKATKELLQQIQGGTYKLPNAGPAMWDEISNEIDAIVSRDYGIYGESGKNIDLKNIIKGFIGGLLEAHGTNSMALRSLVSSNSSTIYSKTKEWGIDLTKIMKYSYSDVINDRAEGLVNEYVDILLNGRQQSQSSKFDETIFNVKNAANDSLYRDSA